MGIFNFKEFSTLEKHGVSEASIIFSEFLENRIYQQFLEFLESPEKSLVIDDVIKYGIIKTYIKDLDLYSDFPVVGFEVKLTFKKMTSEKFKHKFNQFGRGVHKQVAVGGSSSWFGHRNWGDYSKIVEPIKKISNVGIIINIRIEIYINEDSFNIENPVSKTQLEDKLGSTIYHELNHSYEHYKRSIKYRGALYDRSFNTSLTFAADNTWKFPKEIWQFWYDGFLNYIYISERFELNANIQEIYYFIQKYPNKKLDNFTVWENANDMEKFDSEKFYKELLKKISESYNFNDKIFTSDTPINISNRLKDMWISVYEKELKLNKNSSPIISIDTLKNMSCLDFIKYWGKKFNKNGTYLKKKIYKIKNDITNG